MRSIYLVAYDISDDKRRTRIFNKLKGYGEALQYSLFRCALTPGERARLRNDLWPYVDHGADRILLVNLGPDDGRTVAALESWGKPLDDPAAHDGILVI
jgi:CRISPR-associated protein Cas2